MKKIYILSAILFLLAAGCGKQQAQQRDTGTNDTNLEQSQNNQPTTDKKTVTVHQYVDTLGEADYDVSAGETALDLLKSTDKVELKDYGSMGQFVLSIDSVKPDSKHFWEFYVNGKSSNVGAAAYILKADDKVEWKLTAISSSGQ